MASNISRPDYTIELSPGRAVAVELGAGIDMSDPLYPHFRGRPFQPPKEILEKPAKPLKDVSLVALRTNVVEVKHESEEAQRLAINASARYGMASAEAAYTRAHDELHKNQVLYIDIQYEGEGRALNDPQWHTAPPAEKVADDARLRQFVADHGSHYITRVVYGFAVTLRLARDKSIVKDRETFNAAVHAVSKNIGGGAALSAEHSRVITDGHTDVLCVIVAGSITPEAERIVARWEDVRELLVGARAGRVQINTGPIRAEAHSFWHTLTSYPRCRSLFEEKGTIPPPTPFGVPAGTIIAWFPSAARGEVEIDPQRKASTIIPPKGWALCDGKNGTPNLVDRFLLGTNAFERVGKIGGNDQHTHAVSGETLAAHNFGEHPVQYGLAQGANIADHGHSISVTTGATPHLPPFHTVVYIVKL
jgi:hypothetical protein